MKKETLQKANEIQNQINALKKCIVFEFKQKIDNPNVGWRFDLFFTNTHTGGTTDSLGIDSLNQIGNDLSQEFNLGMKEYLDKMCFKIDAEILRLEAEFNKLSDENTSE